MNTWLLSLILVPLFCITMYYLYCQGYAISRSIAAILFYFRPGKTADKATLNSCSGWARHVGRFHESRVYEFTFDAQLTKGDVEVVLLNQRKQLMLRLTQAHPTGRLELDRKSRYYIRWEFKSATGTCELHW